MYVEMAEKDKIYAFFSANSKQIYIDDTDLVEHLQRGKNEPINNTTLALLYEYMDNQIEALKIWSQIKGQEGCDRTVNLLRKDGKPENATKYIKWVLELNPKIGLSLFEDAKNASGSKLEMSPDAVVDYLKEVEAALGSGRDDTFPYVEHYLEYLVSLKESPDRYFTNLALMYIEKLFVCLAPYK